jgi:hypothetical protein
MLSDKDNPMTMKSLQALGLLGLAVLVGSAAPSFAVDQVFTANVPTITSVDFTGSTATVNLTASQVNAGTLSNGLHIIVNTAENSAGDGELTLSSSTGLSGNTFNLANGGDNILATVATSAGTSTAGLSGITAPFTGTHTPTTDIGIYDAAIDLSGMSASLPAGAYTSTLTATFTAP